MFSSVLRRSTLQATTQRGARSLSTFPSNHNVDTSWHPVHGATFPPEGEMPSWATVNPWTMGVGNTPPGVVHNLVDGEFKSSPQSVTIPCPMTGSPMVTLPDVQISELDEFKASSSKVSKTGLHNPFKNPERYVMYGKICHNAGVELAKPEVMDFFAKTIARCMPKSYYQAWYEVKVTADFLKNWGGDNPRFNAGGEHIAGDHAGQESRGYRFPFGPVAIVSPFNFPLEIPVLQLMGALMMGNKPTIKASTTTGLVMDQYLRLLIDCGMPASDVDMITCEGPVMGELIENGPYRVTQFTGSSTIAELLSEKTHGKVKIEDAGFDWKILGPDVNDFDYVSWVCDQDAYACSGQKCSAQSILFMHKNWEEAGIEAKLKELAGKRKLDDLSIGPVMTWTTESIMAHKDKLLAIPGARLAFGGKELENHTTPKIYGMVEPTAVYVPLDELLKEENFDTCVTELFGPFQVLTSYDDASEDKVLEACERMSHHLTAAVVSNDVRFTDRILASTVNGTTYHGLRARTTGAPQNHWFGPGGDPRGAGIGSAYAIQLVWSCHREVIKDTGEIPKNWVTPSPS